MANHLRQPPGRLSSSAKDATRIHIADTAFAKSDADTVSTGMTSSSEDGGSPTSFSAREVAYQTKGKLVTRTPMSRPQTTTKVSTRPQQASKAPERQSRIVKPTGSYSLAKDAPSNEPPQSSRLATTRTSKSSKRSSSDWGTLTRKSTIYRNVSGANSKINSSTKTKGTTPKDELIAKLKKQVEMLHEKQKKTAENNQKMTRNLEAKLEDLRVADYTLIDQLRGERNDLKYRLAEASEKLQSMNEEHEMATQKDLAQKGALERQLVEARSRIQELESSDARKSKIDELQERRRQIESQFSEAGDDDSAKLRQLRSKRETTEARLKHLVTESKGGQTADIMDIEVMTKNLKDELEASKQVISQQKEQLRIVLGNQEDSKEETCLENEAGWKAKFLNLQKRHFQLQYDRAWGEFKLRNRITADGTKFHRRLNHWKGQVSDLKTKMDLWQNVETRGRRRSREVETREQQQQGDESVSTQPQRQPAQRGSWWGFRGGREAV